MISTPKYFPDGFDLELAKLCARLSSYAYDMYTQWTKQGKPRKERGFRWTPPSDAGLTFSAPFWSAEEVLWVFNEAEPFGFCARDRAGTGYLVFRRTSSNSDWADDADVDQRGRPPQRRHQRNQRGRRVDRDPARRIGVVDLHRRGGREQAGEREGDAAQRRHSSACAPGAPRGRA